MRGGPSTGKGQWIIMRTKWDYVYGRKDIHPE